MSHDNTYYLACAPIGRSLLHLCIPMMAAMSVGVIYNIVNAGFIGSLRDTSMLAALTFGLPVLTLVMAIGGMFGAGGSASISRLLGRAETDPNAIDDARRIGGFVTYGSLLTGALVAAVALALLGPLVAGLGVDAASAAATTRYVAGLLVFTPVLVTTFAVDQLVRAEGAARASMIGTIVATVANLVLDAVFILVLDLDVLGAALGMGLASLLSLGYYLAWLHRHSTVLSLAPRWFSLGRRVVRPVLTIGASELLMSSFMLVSTLTLNHVAVHHGDSTMAAFGVAQRIVQLPEMLAMGVFVGVLPLVAYAYGAADWTRVRAALRASSVAIAGLVGVFSTAVLLLRQQVFAPFATSHDVVKVGIHVVAAMLVSSAFNGFTGLIMTWFQASEQAGRAALLGTLQGGLFIPVVLLLDHAYGLTGLIWSITVAEGLCLVVGAVLASSGRRLLAVRGEAAPVIAAAPTVA